MSKQRVDGVWVIVCDWVDEKGQACTLGRDGEPRMFVDPDAGRSEDLHFQCGLHHGVLKQKDKPEFQLPDDHKLNEEILRPGEDGDEVSVEEIEDDE